MTRKTGSSATSTAGLIALIALAAVVLTPRQSHAQDLPGLPGLAGSLDPVQVEAVWSAPKAQPASQRVIAVVIQIDNSYHINPPKGQIPDEFKYLIPVTVEATDVPEGLTLGPMQFPQAHDVTVSYSGKRQVIRAYEGQTVIYVPVLVGAETSLGAKTVKLRVGYQACDEKQCQFPKKVDVTAALEIVPVGVPTGEPDEALFAGFDTSVFAKMQGGGAPRATSPATSPPVASPSVVKFDLFGRIPFSLDPSGAAGLALLLAVAALGGLLLNLTPCVLPVIPIKIMGLSQSAGNRARCLALGMSMSLGVVAFWLGLGVAIASFTRFTATNQLFQMPWFTIGVGVVIAVMAVGMCGLFAVRLPQWVYAINPKHDSFAGSFGFGVMTAVLSTPCTAPFMGGAAAWAVTQPAAATLATFAAIGAGMAFPYLLLSAFPALVQKMPRTGPASELIKQVMGLLMLAAAAYFVGVGLSGVFKDPAGPASRGYWWAVFACIAAAGVWLAWRTFRITASPPRRAIFAGVGLLMLAASAYGAVALTEPEPVQWVYYTPQRYQQAIEAGNVVVMDFTAEWCLNCKWLEQNVLNSKTVADLLAQKGVVPMRVDLTGNNTAGNQMLTRTGRLTIPLLVVYTPSGAEAFKSDFYTAEQVVGAVTAARASQAAAAER